MDTKITESVSIHAPALGATNTSYVKHMTNGFSDTRASDKRVAAGRFLDS